MTCNSHDVHTFCSLQICHAANPALRHKHTRQPVVWDYRYVLRLREHVRACGCVISHAPQRHTSKLLYILWSVSPSVSEAVDAHCHFYSLLLGNAALVQGSVPGDNKTRGECCFFRPLNIRWDVNKLFLIPGCLLCSVHVHTYVTAHGV